VLERAEDRSGDGRPDFTAFFQGGVTRRIEAESAGKGCVDVRQWLDASGNVTAEEKDTEGNCRFDTWSYYEGGRLVRQGRDTRSRGHADVLGHFDASGRLTLQELVTGEGRQPDKKLFLDASGRVTRHCADSDGDGVLDMVLFFDGDVLREAWIDTTGSGKPDQREVYEGGQRVRLDADTSGNGRADVVQHFAGEALTRQDEDSDNDGRADRRFENEQVRELSDHPPMPPAFEPLGCGTFHAFWKR
jgi:hypothetical protein